MIPCGIGWIMLLAISVIHLFLNVLGYTDLCLKHNNIMRNYRICRIIGDVLNSAGW